MEKIQPALTKEEIDQLESRLGVALPSSYKEFLQVSGGFWLLGGAIKLGTGKAFSPFIYEQPLSPSDGILCFGDLFMDSDGDQPLFYVKDGLKNGEYPVTDYDHESKPPTVRKRRSRFEIGWKDFSPMKLSS